VIANATGTPAIRAAGWLCLAATPVFAMMAVLTAAFGGDMPMICSAGPDAFPLGGMVPMYLLMSAFHAAPWLRLISDRPAGNRSRRSETPASHGQLSNVPR
jgi:hypothetical protein